MQYFPKFQPGDALSTCRLEHDKLFKLPVFMATMSKNLSQLIEILRTFCAFLQKIAIKLIMGHHTLKLLLESLTQLDFLCNLSLFLPFLNRIFLVRFLNFTLARLSQLAIKSWLLRLLAKSHGKVFLKSQKGPYCPEGPVSRFLQGPRQILADYQLADWIGFNCDTLPYCRCSSLFS